MLGVFNYSIHRVGWSLLYLLGYVLYGICYIIVATPFGKYTIEKKDGGVSFMGISAKLVSSKNDVYIIKSSLGNFTVNARKGTVTKN